MAINFTDGKYVDENGHVTLDPTVYKDWQIAEEAEKTLPPVEYFREKLMTQERFTEVGSYWDNKGENEIDLIALNDLDRTALVAEVKRNPAKINLQTLARKAETLRKELAKYRMELRGLSLEDM